MEYAVVVFLGIWLLFSGIFFVKFSGNKEERK